MFTVNRLSLAASDRDPAYSAAQRTVQAASSALNELATWLDESGLSHALDRLLQTIYDSSGRVIVAGMGKSGLVGRKLVATLTSTGTPALFLHPAEAGHGDLGMVSPRDTMVLITRSGETSEFAEIIRYCKRFRCPLAVITSEPESSAALAADICLVLPKVREACPIALAPTTSTTLQGVFGDAIAIGLMEMRGFSADDFHTFHPAGRLGARLLKVRDVMVMHDVLPKVREDTSLLETALEMTRGRLGGTAVMNGDRLTGVFTDGDLRRAINANGRMDEPVGRYMTPRPIQIQPHDLASDARNRMLDSNITLLFVVQDDRLVGAVHLTSVSREGVI